MPASRAESRARLLLGDELVEDVPFCRASFAEARSNWSTETVGRSTVSTTLLALARSPSLSSSHSRPLSGSAFTSTTKSNCLSVHCGLVGFCVRTLQALSANPKLPCGKRSTRHQARDAAPHSSSSAHGSEENAGLSGESGESGALMRGIKAYGLPTSAHLLASRSVTKLEIPSNNFENKKRTQSSLLHFRVFGLPIARIPGEAKLRQVEPLPLQHRPLHLHRIVPAREVVQPGPRAPREAW